MAGNQVRIGVGVKDNASAPIKGISDAFHRLQKQGGQGFAIGAGAAATAKAFSLLDSAASGVINVLGDAVKAAMADEESVNRLGASLRTNIPAWNGNTAAIEKSIVAAQRLGFEDETLRDSLTVLVGATHDVAKAQAIQNIAMDLARFKGIDLRTASEALIKVEGGHYRSLAQLGIKLKEGATQTEALAAVQKIAAGQAEAYANTLSGKVAAAQIKFSEQLENLGTKLLPAVASGLEGLNIAADTLGTIGDAMSGRLTPQVAGLARVFGLVTDEQLRAYLVAEKLAAGTRHMADATKDDLIPALTDAIGPTADETDEMKALRVEFGKTSAAANDLSDELNTLTGIMFDSDIAAGDIAQAQKDLQEVLKEGPGSKAPGAWTIWNGKVQEARKRLFELQFQEKQTEGPAALQAWLIKQRDALDKADVKGRAYIATLLKMTAAMLLLAGAADKVKDDTYVPPPPVGGGSGNGGTRPLAQGGPMSPNQPYIVGEKGPELIVPTSSGTVIPNDRLGGMGGVTVNLTVQGDLRARSKEDVVSALRRAAAFIR